MCGCLCVALTFPGKVCTACFPGSCTLYLLGCRALAAAQSWWALQFPLRFALNLQGPRTLITSKFVTDLEFGWLFYFILFYLFASAYIPIWDMEAQGFCLFLFLSFFRNRKKNCGSCWHNWAFSYSSSSVQFYEAWAVQSSPSLLGKGRDRRAISEPCRDFSSTWRGNMEKWMLITGRGERLLLMAERRICCKNEFVCSVCLCFPLQKAN